MVIFMLPVVFFCLQIQVNVFSHILSVFPIGFYQKYFFFVLQWQTKYVEKNIENCLHSCYWVFFPTNEMEYDHNAWASIIIVKYWLIDEKAKWHEMEPNALSGDTENRMNGNVILTGLVIWLPSSFDPLKWRKMKEKQKQVDNHETDKTNMKRWIHVLNCK